VTGPVVAGLLDRRYRVKRGIGGPNVYEHTVLPDQRRAIVGRLKPEDIAAAFGGLNAELKRRSGIEPQALTHGLRDNDPSVLVNGNLHKNARSELFDQVRGLTVACTVRRI
jgi:hypothetical protein